MKVILEFWVNEALKGQLACTDVWIPEAPRGFRGLGPPRCHPNLVGVSFRSLVFIYYGFWI